MRDRLGDLWDRWRCLPGLDAGVIITNVILVALIVLAIVMKLTGH